MKATLSFDDMREYLFLSYILFLIAAASKAWRQLINSNTYNTSHCKYWIIFSADSFTLEAEPLILLD
jgi:hypothetical protein